MRKREVETTSWTIILANGASYDFKECVVARRLSLAMRVEVGKRQQGRMSTSDCELRSKWLRAPIFHNYIHLGSYKCRASQSGDWLRLRWSLFFVAVITSIFASIALNVILRRRSRQLKPGQ